MIRLYHGDCKNVIKELPEKYIDLMVVDPPYNFGAKGGGFYSEDNEDKRTYIDSLDSLDCLDFEPIPFLDSVKSKMKKIYMYIFCNKTLVADYIEWAKKNKCSYDILTMIKQNPIPAYNNHYLSDTEYIIVIREPGTYFSKEKDIELYRKWFMTTCKKGVHPAEKPLELIKKFIKVGSPEHALVFDPFMGSGTTGVAAEELRRDFIGCEINEQYFEICKKGLRNAKLWNLPIFQNLKKRKDSYSDMADKIIRIKQATKKGYIEMKSGGVCDVSYPESKLRRGRVQGGGDISPTLTCTGEAIVRIEIVEDKRMEKAEETKTKDATEKYAIRKLTENETWRLMGFSDEDFNKAAKVNSRSQLYKQSGNSIVKQVLMAIFLQLGIQGKKRWNDMTVEERQKLVDSSLDFIEK